MTVPDTPQLAAVDTLQPRWTDLADGLLADFQVAGVLTAADVHVAVRLGRLGQEQDERVLLAIALTVRAARLGSVCLDLAAAPTQIAPAEADEPVVSPQLPPPPQEELPWPEPTEWLAACSQSPVVDPGPQRATGRPLQLVGQLLYLDRYWQQEQLVASELVDRATRSVTASPAFDAQRMQAALERIFPPAKAKEEQGPRAAARTAAARWLTVVAGGPGTGKTTTVAGILALLADQPGPLPHIALAAPTGKAAARLEEAVRDALADLAPEDRARLGPLPASTLHRLLGRKPGTSSRFRHDAGNRLPHDIVVVDESSMISLTLMARLLDAVRKDARLVLVGDPDQLASVDAGAVLGDIVDAARAGEASAGEAAFERSALQGGIVTLSHRWRFGGRIADLASAIQAGDEDAVMAILRTPTADVSFVDVDAGFAGPAATTAALAGLREDVLQAAHHLIDAARRADQAAALESLGKHRLLCAHRHGPYGVDRWGPELDRWIDSAYAPRRGIGDWYPGRPLLVTENDYEIGLFNGDTGVVVSDGAGGVTAAFGHPSDPRSIRPARLGAVQTMQAMTIHRSQGSQFERVSVLLPAEGSPLLTRQLLYTAVTRAQHHVRIIGGEAAIRTAVTTPIARASGLRERFAAGAPAGVEDASGERPPV